MAISNNATPQRWSRFAALFPLLALLLIGFFIACLTSMTPPKVSIQSTPAGATVILNGRLMGATPLTLVQLQPGEYSMLLEKQGFASVAKIVTLGGSGAVINESMEAIGNGKLTVDIKPRGAEVLLDGEFIGHTPLKDSDVPAGGHDLLVRKTNFKPQAWHIDVTAREPILFQGFELEDQVLVMLRQQCETDKQRVANYMDLGHYLFVNDELDEAAEAYAKALQVAGTPLEFDANADPAEKQLEQRLRAEDQNRLNDEVRKKSNWPGKDVARFKKTMEAKQEEVANINFTEWNWVQESANNFIRQDKLDRAQSLLLKHIGAVKTGSPNLPQAYIALLALRLRMHNLQAAKETFDQFYNLYSQRADLGRQAANSIYSTYASYQGDERRQVLGMAEKLLQRAVDITKKGDPEMLALCKFELANVMTLQGRADSAVPVYKESIDGTKHEETRQQRRQRLVEAYRSVGAYADARALLTDLSASTIPQIADKAKADLRELELQKPSPDGK